MNEKNNLLHRKLSIEDQDEILSDLFGFQIDDDVIIDDDGCEFYGMNKNDQFDLSTLNGIFAYAANRAKNQGYSDCQYDIKRVLNIR